MTLKTIKLKHILSLGIIAILLACSTKKDNFVNRKWHSVNTEYNTLYNGGLALDKGIEEVKATYSDNFWEVLPLERMQITEEEQKPGDTKNPNFERAETKATKAIQKHSMNIGGFEKNNQIDESYLMLGKARYYEHRYLPAMEAFNYILYKYPNSNNVYQAQVWREKVNLKLENEQLAIKNLNRTLKGQRVKGQDLADVHSVLAQAYITTNVLDSAIASVKISKKETRLKEEKARYTFILAQLYEKLNYKDSAFVAYQEVIDMKRKSPRSYTIYAHLKQSTQFDFETGDTVAFHKKLDKQLENIENKNFRDVIHHQRATFYDKTGNDKLAIANYNKSLKNMSADRYLAALNFRNISNIHYRNKNFHASKKYLDSTLIHLSEKNNEFKPLKKRLELLTDVVKYQDIITQADSISMVSRMSSSDKIKYYQEYIDKLKISDSIAAKKLTENTSVANQNPKLDMISQDKPNENMLMPPGVGGAPDLGGKSSGKVATIEPPITKTPPANIAINSGGLQSSFYFYNPATVAQGKINFKKKWGDIQLRDNWKTVSTTNQNQINNNNSEEIIEEETPDKNAEIGLEPKYTTAFYIDKLPKDPKILDSLNIEANYARFQLGSIFKEKLKENKLAITSFENILVNKPESKLILPTYYNLYQLYGSENGEKASVYKQKILSEYPESRYASAFNNTTINADITANSEFNTLYAKVEKGLYREANAEVDALLKKYDGDELNAKFDVLKAKISARLFGLSAYKTALQKIVKNYPKGEETKKIESILASDIPALEALDFGKPAKTFNLVFVTNYPNEISHKNLLEKLNKYAKESGDVKIKVSNDIYDVEKNMIVLHGILNKATAESVYNYLKEHKDYKVKDTPIIISNEDYKVVQVKKNLEEYLAKIK